MSFRCTLLDDSFTVAECAERFTDATAVNNGTHCDRCKLGAKHRLQNALGRTPTDDEAKRAGEYYCSRNDSPAHTATARWLGALLSRD